MIIDLHVDMKFYLYRKSITPSPGSLVAHHFDSPNQLHVSALIPEPKSPGQGPSFPSGSHFTLNEFQFQQSLAPSSQCGSQSPTCCKCYTSGARCTSCKCCREGHPCVNCYPGRSGKCANVVLSSTCIYTTIRDCSPTQ